jgi:hypothetical protein
MGGFYFISFFDLWAAFVDRQWCRIIWLIVLPFSFFKNSSKSFFKVLASNVTASVALGIHLKPQSV